MGERQVTGKISLVDAMSAPLRQMTQHMEQTSRAARELDTKITVSKCQCCTASSGNTKYITVRP